MTPIFHNRIGCQFVSQAQELTPQLKRMPLNFEKLTKNEGYGCVNTSSLGELCAFSIIVRDMMALETEFQRPVEEVPKDSYLRSYFRYTVFPKGSLQEGLYKPEEPALTQSDVLKLSEQDLDQISSIIVDAESYLWEDSEGNRTEQKKTEESDSDFLYRLLAAQDRKMRAQRERILGKNLFSHSLGEKIGKTLGMGNLLTKNLKFLESTGSIGGISMPEKGSGFGEMFGNKSSSLLADLKIVPKELPSFAIPPDKKVELLAEIGTTLKKLTEVTAESASFGVKANEIQMEIASEIKRSSQDSNDSATESIRIAQEGVNLTRDNIRLTKWVLIFTIAIPLLLALVSWLAAADDGEKQNELTVKSVNQIVSEIGSLNKTIAENTDSKVSDLKEQFAAAQKTIENLQSQNERLQQFRESDAKAMSELKEAYLKLQKDIEGVKNPVPKSIDQVR